MKKALIIFLVIGLAFVFELGFIEAETVKMSLTIKPMPFDLNSINQAAGINWDIDISSLAANPNIIVVTIF